MGLPLFAGSSQVTASEAEPGSSLGTGMSGPPGLPPAESDHGPAPWSFTAATCTL